jgi:hypothetical protein
MKNLLIVAALGLVAWLAYTRVVDPSANESRPQSASGTDDASEFLSAESAAVFTCDGRTHCSQMTSCAEAEYFLKHCPGVEMDGNNDGEPCESQWCGNSR